MRGVGRWNRLLFSAGDVRRLTLLREATELGHSIGAIASLPDLELEVLLAAVAIDDEMVRVGAVPGLRLGSAGEEQRGKGQQLEGGDDLARKAGLEADAQPEGRGQEKGERETRRERHAMLRARAKRQRALTRRACASARGSIRACLRG